MALPRRNRSFSPIPGTEPPRRGLFVDRWGTLLELPDGSFPRFEAVRWIPGAIDALFRASSASWNVYLIGNEDEVAQGRVPDAEWQEFESALLAHLRGHGITIARNYACLEDVERGAGKHRRDSVFRLPDTGIFFHAEQHDGVQLRHSFVVGDTTLEIAAGGRAGCKTIGVATGRGCRDGELHVEPEIRCANLAEAVDLFRSSESLAAG
jgi:histidinol phosphatase-like enzyme